MAIEHIDEPVKVRADFQAGAIQPLRIRRGHIVHRVQQVHARWIDRKLAHPRYFFSLTTDTGELLQVVLRTEDMTWHLESITLG